MSCDELWPGGPKLIRSPEVFALGTDAVLLSAFPDASNVKTVCDLGCGSGIVSLLLAWNNPGLRAVGVELLPGSAEIAGENMLVNGLAERVNIIRGDMREYRGMEGAGGFDLVVSNPPYFPVGSGKAARAESIASARDERCCTLADVCAAAAYFTRWGGRFALVHRPERLSEVFCAMTAAGIEPKRLRLVQDRPGAAPNLALIEGRRGGKPGLSVEAPLLMHDEAGRETEFIRTIYHR